MERILDQRDGYGSESTLDASEISFFYQVNQVEIWR